MYESTCKMCGAPMVATVQHNIRQFCSKKCYGAFNHMKQCEKEDLQKEPDAPMMKNISDDGFVALIAAIVDQASWDVLHGQPNSYNRMDAERFFLSEYFEALTGLDGREVLDKLKRKREKGKGWKDDAE